MIGEKSATILSCQKGLGERGKGKGCWKFPQGVYKHSREKSMNDSPGTPHDKMGEKKHHTGKRGLLTGKGAGKNHLA